MPFGKWIRIVIALTLFLISVVVAINAAVDTYGILRFDVNRQLQSPNLNYIKTEYLLQNPRRYSSFLFGASRVGVIDINKVPGVSGYNMTVAEGLPQEYLDCITLLLEKGVTIKSLLIGLDEFSYQVDPRNHLSSLERQPHPAASGKRRDIFFGQYFLTLHRFLPRIKAYLREAFADDAEKVGKVVLFDVYESGRIIWLTADEEIERDVRRHIESVKFGNPVYWDGNNMPEALSALKRIVELSNRNGIAVTFFINPVHKTTYLYTDLRKFALFKKELVRISDFYDFSGLNSITTNNYYYYETSHFRPVVGDMMLKTMFGAPQSRSVPPDFGFFVNKQNIDRHLRTQCLEIRQARTSAAFNSMNISFSESCDSTTHSLVIQRNSANRPDA